MKGPRVIVWFLALLFVGPAFWMSIIPDGIPAGVGRGMFVVTTFALVLVAMGMLSARRSRRTENPFWNLWVAAGCCGPGSFLTSLFLVAVIFGEGPGRTLPLCIFVPALIFFWVGGVWMLEEEKWRPLWTAPKAQI